MHNFDVSIKRTIEIIKENTRNISPIELDVRTTDNGLMPQTGLTPLGYKVLIKTLCTSITQLAKSAKEQGMSEGEIIGDAINQIKANLIDPHQGKPSSKMHRIIKARNRKSKR